MIFFVLNFLGQPLTVGAITDETVLTQRISSHDADVIELRLDALGAGTSVLEFAKAHSESIPLLITARDPIEGGFNNLTQEQRYEYLEALLPYAKAIDVELVNIEKYRPFIRKAKAKGIKVILSNHDFVGFDHMATIEVLAQAQAEGADVAKAAVTLKDPVDLTLFESLLADLEESSFSLMGMGCYGPVSRILAAQHGSVLNYGYLGNQPTAPGQWPSPLLKQVLTHSPSL